MRFPEGHHRFNAGAGTRRMRWRDEMMQWVFELGMLGSGTGERAWPMFPFKTKGKHLACSQGRGQRDPESGSASSSTGSPPAPERIGLVGR